MDAFADPSVEEIVVMSSAQVGKTEILNNIVGFFISMDPSPILIVQPTLDMGEAWSKDRLVPMLRDTACLRSAVRDPRSRDSGNTLLHKVFPGGHLTIAGSNSAASLASRPIRIALCDEVDRYPASAGTEGDPVSLAFKRTANFWNRKKALFSTPTIKGSSRIEAAYEGSDKRRYAVPCPKCGEFQFLSWQQVKWEDGAPEAAEYECLFCKERWSDGDRFRAIRFGKWEATGPFTGVAGFHLSAIYSPWTSLREVVRQWLESQRSPEQLKTFVNTVLGETWEERHDAKIDAHVLMERCEDFGEELPEGVAIITAGVDVQADRLVAEVVGWGRDEESWSLGTHVIPGDTARVEVWAGLDDLLTSEYSHPCGLAMKIRAACIDSGYKDAMVLRFARDKYGRRVFAVKGRAGDLPIWPRKPSRKNQTPFFIVGVDAVKDSVYERLRIADEGPGYCHFPEGRDLAWFEELTAERKVTSYPKGYAKREWRKDPGQRNEAIDCRVYSYAALHSLYASGGRLNVEAERIEKMLLERRQRPAQPVAPPPPAAQRDSWFGGRTSGNWFNR